MNCTVVLLLGLAAVAVHVPMRRKRCEPAPEPWDRASRQSLRAELVAATSGPNAAIAAVLKTLQRKGLLNDPQLGCDDEAQQLTHASHAHADFETQYGTVVQTIGLNGSV